VPGFPVARQVVVRRAGFPSVTAANGPTMARVPVVRQAIIRDPRVPSVTAQGDRSDRNHPFAACGMR
jgi:hypothetical protein